MQGGYYLQTSALHLEKFALFFGWALPVKPKPQAFKLG